MTGYGQFCPVSKAAEVICQRWTPLVLRELLLGSSRFNEIRRGIPTCPPAMLSKRLKELEAAGVVKRDPTGASWLLTEAGRELFPMIQALGEWGQRWARSSYDDDDLDPGLLLWDVRRFVQPRGLGDGRFVVSFRFPALGPRHRFYWLVADGREVDLCLIDPGIHADLHVEADLRALTKVWMGDITFDEAIANGSIRLDGSRRLTQTFPSWFGQHPVLSGIARAR